MFVKASLDTTTTIASYFCGTFSVCKHFVYRYTVLGSTTGSCRLCDTEQRKANHGALWPKIKCSKRFSTSFYFCVLFMWRISPKNVFFCSFSYMVFLSEHVWINVVTFHQPIFTHRLSSQSTCVILRFKFPL